MWLSAPNITCIHGFSNRHGGVSQPPFDTLNLGGSQDEASRISDNRNLALKHLHLNSEKLCTLKQVHGTAVCEAMPGSQEGDALVTNESGLILAVSIADCYPLLLHDPVNRVIAAVHAGWRGTAGKIAARAVEALVKLGAEVSQIQAAIGQGISQQKFEVGKEVIAEFEQAGFPENNWQNNRIDLAACNQWVLAQSGIQEKNTWLMNRCTFEDDFFSYRRDKGVTGRMWALIQLS